MAKLNNIKSYTRQKTCEILARRKKRNNKKHLAVIPWYKTRSWDLKLSDMPTAVLLKIFSFLPLEDLYLNIRLVNTHWYNLAASSCLWKTIAVGPDIPLPLLLNWLENTPKLDTLKIQNRLDAGEILQQIHKYNKNIKHINIHDCWGCDRRINLPSGALCNILLRCPYLDSISLRGSRFISCKFFRILASRDMILEKRRRCIDHTRRSRKIQYYGSALKKQLQVFLKSRLDSNKNRLALLSVETNPSVRGSNITVRQEIVVRSEEDIEKILSSLQFE